MLRGPQGSTIYGSDASGGGMQIFTKKGAFNTPYPRVEAKVSAGFIESPWVQNAQIQQDHSIAVTGGGSEFGYRLGGGYSHHGEWAPEYRTTNKSLNGGMRATQGPLTVEFSARYYDKSSGAVLDPRFRDAGYNYWSKPFDETDILRQQTYGLTAKYLVTPRWQHNLTLGYDRDGLDLYNNHPRFTTPADSLFYVTSFDETKSSIAYNTTYEASLGTAIHSSLTAGADYWAYHQTGFFAGAATANANTIGSPDAGYRYQYHNAGYFAQAQVGLRHALFMTAGIRAEDNQNFGKDYGLAWAPRAGLSYVHTFGNLTAKARVAYGRAIRPPAPAKAQAVVTPFSVQLANPGLGPEQQVGPDAGLELYFGTRASLEATYYHQTAIDLIDQVVLGVSPRFTVQNQNVGRIRNKGWEFQGRLNAGQLVVTGTYSITNSVVETLSPTYTGNLHPGDQMLDIPQHTVGATLSYSLHRTAITLGMTHIGSWTETDWVALYGFYFAGQQYRGSGRAYWITYPAFTKFNLSMSQGITQRINVFLRSDNLTNQNVFERNNLFLNTGRVTVVGVRTTL